MEKIKKTVIQKIHKGFLLFALTTMIGSGILTSCSGESDKDKGSGNREERFGTTSGTPAETPGGSTGKADSTQRDESLGGMGTTSGTNAGQDTTSGTTTSGSY